MNVCSNWGQWSEHLERFRFKFLEKDTIIPGKGGGDPLEASQGLL